MSWIQAAREWQNFFHDTRAHTHTRRTFPELAG